MYTVKICSCFIIFCFLNYKQHSNIQSKIKEIGNKQTNKKLRPTDPIDRVAARHCCCVLQFIIYIKCCRIFLPCEPLAPAPPCWVCAPPTSALWMCGMTPPPAMVALMSKSSSSSPRMANCKWRGLIRFTFKSLLALPANSRTSAVRYSRIAAV